ncbi:MAG: hypothetical protein ABUL61_07300 [Oleiharenicola lentus]
MKTLRLFACLFCFLPVLGAATTEPAPAMPTPSTNVSVPTTASELAAGYAAAIQQMSLKSLVIYLKSDGKVIALKGLRSARAVSAVLLITFSAGDMMAINAENIVLITDGARTP